MAKQEKSTAELYREERKKRIAKAAKSKSKKHISEKTQNRIAGAIAILIVIAILGAVVGGIVNNKGVFERNKVIMTIGDTEIDKYEYSYYYNQLLQQQISQTIQYEMYGIDLGGCDFTQSLASQAYTGELEGYENPTYADYFSKSAIDYMKYIKACVAYAEENEIVLTEDDYKQIDDIFAQIDKGRTNQDGSKYSVGAYLRLSYGKGMTEDLYRKIISEQLLAERVTEVKQEELKASYSDEVIEKAYTDGIDNYGRVTYRSYTFKPVVAEGAEAATEEAIAEAKAAAEDFLANVQDEASFKALAAEYAKSIGDEKADTFLTDDTLTLSKDIVPSQQLTLDEAMLKWAKEAKAGATYLQEGESDFTVYYMVNPVHKAEDTVADYDVRHILIEFSKADETVTDGDAKEEVTAVEFDASKYEATVVNNVKTPITDAESYNKAVEVLTSYLEGDKTEDAFAELAKEHSADGNAAQGGIYENVPLEGQGSMVDEFEGWAADMDRKAGDVGIVETTYGYHIMYYIDKTVTTWSDEIKDALATEDYNTFYEELVAADNVTASELDAEMSADVNANMDAASKNIYNNYMSYYSQQSSYGF